MILISIIGICLIFAILLFFIAYKKHKAKKSFNHQLFFACILSAITPLLLLIWLDNKETVDNFNNLVDSGYQVINYDDEEDSSLLHKRIEYYCGDEDDQVKYVNRNYEEVNSLIYKNKVGLVVAFYTFCKKAYDSLDDVKSITLAISEIEDEEKAKALDEILISKKYKNLGLFDMFNNELGTVVFYRGKNAIEDNYCKNTLFVNSETLEVNDNVFLGSSFYAYCKEPDNESISIDIDGTSLSEYSALDIIGVNKEGLDKVKSICENIIYTNGQAYSGYPMLSKNTKLLCKDRKYFK